MESAEEVDFMVIDEVYTYVGKRRERAYIWTCLAKIDGEMKKFFHLSRQRTIMDLFEFNLDLPFAICTDRIF